ncbi:MAG: ATP-binding cassette domain-containing protein [Bifidobacterium aquikefiri]|uniref:Methionine ABC transporter ATP-binding protein n=1 Tax=Bifidobacterium aquikefiri TaxID=1653207 RepID=A0A261G6R0_9BIFI|nr:ATP-binding cassette domain-containing protein [Bifidobacterium aquikefiri]OZG67092.1 methionine ABC transporter ATP-binding protein [Bifidobacterium aquikefiri]
MIELNDIVVKFPQKGHVVTAVNHVSLAVDDGSMYGIVGFSGAGKSTLVRVMNLLQKPTSGSVIVNGTDLIALSERALRKERRNIGMIFQHFNLMESRTIFDNVDFPLKGSGISKVERRQRIEKLLDLVGILEKKDAYPYQLSGGQKQRVAIARALATDPKILLCDEATSALDPKTTIAVLQLLKEINDRLGITIVIITHEMQVVKEICDHVAVMEEGKIIERGEVADIFSNPQKPLTQDFIRTAGHIDQAETTILEHVAGEDVYELRFSGSRASEPILIDIYKRFGLTANILYANVEYLQNKPLGTMLVTFDSSDQLGEVEQHLQQDGISMSKVVR